MLHLHNVMKWKLMVPTHVSSIFTNTGLTSISNWIYCISSAPFVSLSAFVVPEFREESLTARFVAQSCGGESRNIFYPSTFNSRLASLEWRKHSWVTRDWIRGESKLTERSAPPRGVRGTEVVPRGCRYGQSDGVHVRLHSTLGPFFPLSI